MPTRQPTPLLLLATLVCASVAAEGADTLVPDFDRFRPTTASNGPRSAPRLADASIEPASFQALADVKPIDPPVPEAEPAVEPPAARPQEPRVKVTQPEPAPQVPAAVTAVLAEPAAAPTPPLAAAAAPSIAPLATHPAPAPDPQPEVDGRRLLGRSRAADKPTARRSAGLGENPLESLMSWRPTTQTLTATGGGLAIAVGLLVAMTCLVRGCLPKSARPLPRDVVEVLGRAPLGGKQTTQLVRVGSKLVLIAITPDGPETLTEITDPGEVARLVAACDSNSGRGANAEFDSMLQEMSDERATPGFLDTSDRQDGPLGFDPRSLAAAYANTPGGRGDG